MEKELSKIFQKAAYSPEVSLQDAICLCIHTKEQRLAKLKLWSFAFISLASLGGLAPVLRILTNDLAKSGFYSYSSLLFSDGGLMFSYWKEFALSLTESLPIMSITLTLSLFFAFFFSLRHFMKHIKRSAVSEISPLSL